MVFNDLHYIQIFEKVLISNERVFSGGWRKLKLYHHTFKTKYLYTIYVIQTYEIIMVVPYLKFYLIDLVIIEWKKKVSKLTYPTFQHCLIMLQIMHTTIMTGDVGQSGSKPQLNIGYKGYT